LKNPWAFFRQSAGLNKLSGGPKPGLPKKLGEPAAQRPGKNKQTLDREIWEVARGPGSPRAIFKRPKTGFPREKKSGLWANCWAPAEDFYGARPNNRGQIFDIEGPISGRMPGPFFSGGRFVPTRFSPHRAGPRLSAHFARSGLPGSGGAGIYPALTRWETGTAGERPGGDTPHPCSFESLRKRKWPGTHVPGRFPGQREGAKPLRVGVGRKPPFPGCWTSNPIPLGTQAHAATGPWGHSFFAEHFRPFPPASPGRSRAIVFPESVPSEGWAPGPGRSAGRQRGPTRPRRALCGLAFCPQVNLLGMFPIYR